MKIKINIFFGCFINAKLAIIYCGIVITLARPPPYAFPINNPIIRAQLNIIISESFSFLLNKNQKLIIQVEHLANDLYIIFDDCHKYMAYMVHIEFVK